MGFERPQTPARRRQWLPAALLPLALAAGAIEEEEADLEEVEREAEIDDVIDAEIMVTHEVARPEIDEERGHYLYRSRCAVCHGVGGTGDGAAARNITPRPADLTTGVYKFRSTPSGRPPTDEDLFRTITEGLPGTAMPGWRGLSVDDRWQLVFHVKSLSSAFAGETVDPLPVPEPLPMTRDRVEHGRALFGALGCGYCHGPEGRGDGEAEPTLTDHRGEHIFPADLSQPGRFKGGASARDIYRTLHTGIDGTPMGSFHGMLADEDSWALVHFVRSLRLGEGGVEVQGDSSADTRLQRQQDQLADAKREALVLRAQIEQAATIANAHGERIAELTLEIEGLKQHVAAGVPADQATAPAPVDATVTESPAPDDAAAERAAKREALNRERLAAARASATKLYATRCAVCHGVDGDGMGPAGPGLNPKPRAFNDKAWQQGVSDSRIEKAIVEGGPAVGASALMPGSPDLARRPSVVRELRNIVRAFAEKGAHGG